MFYDTLLYIEPIRQVFSEVVLVVGIFHYEGGGSMASHDLFDIIVRTSCLRASS
jgi:hypothetical protein